MFSVVFFFFSKLKNTEKKIQNFSRLCRKLWGEKPKEEEKVGIL